MFMSSTKSPYGLLPVGSDTTVMHAAQVGAPPAPDDEELPPAPPSPPELELCDVELELELDSPLDELVLLGEEHDAESAAKTKIHVHFIAQWSLPVLVSSGSERQ